LWFIHHRYHGAAVVVVEPPPLSLLTHCCRHCWAAAVVVEPPSLSWSHHRCCGAAIIVRRRRRRQRQWRRRRRQRKGRRSNYCTRTIQHAQWICYISAVTMQTRHVLPKVTDQTPTSPNLLNFGLILHLSTSLIKAQPLLKLNSTICSSCIFNFLPGLSHHLKRQPSVAPGGHAVYISYGILKGFYACSPVS
jgi:hypothetical protein